MLEILNTTCLTYPNNNNINININADAGSGGGGGEHLINHPVVLHNTQLFERVEVVRMKLDVMWKHARNLRVVDVNGKSVACQVHNVLIPAVNVDRRAGKTAAGKR